MQFGSYRPSTPLSAGPIPPITQRVISPMLLEETDPEEEKIVNLEREITDKGEKGESVDALLEKRKQIYERWIARIDRELRNARIRKEIDQLKRKRERVINQYG
jgi:hypothetical protein